MKPFGEHRIQIMGNKSAKLTYENYKQLAKEQNALASFDDNTMTITLSKTIIIGNKP